VAESLAGEVGISRSQVWRILDDLDLKPHRARSWLTSRDPKFWEKAADVCGLYLDPPDMDLTATRRFDRAAVASSPRASCATSAGMALRRASSQW
jgi:hypothetical protein